MLLAGNHYIYPKVLALKSLARITVPTSITAQEWFHVEYRLGSDGTIKTYLDGVENLSAASSVHETGRIALRARGNVWVDNILISN